MRRLTPTGRGKPAITVLTDSPRESGSSGRLNGDGIFLPPAFPPTVEYPGSRAAMA
jgi:hypothetical protein